MQYVKKQCTTSFDAWCKTNQSDSHRPGPWDRLEWIALAQHGRLRKRAVLEDQPSRRSNVVFDRFDSEVDMQLSSAIWAMSHVWSKRPPTYAVELDNQMSEPQALWMLGLSCKSIHSAGMAP